MSRITRPQIRRFSPQLQGLRMFMPWQMSGTDRTGLFAAIGSATDSGMAFLDGITAGGASGPPQWYNDPRFGAVPDFVNDTNNYALTSVNAAYSPSNLAPLTFTGWVWPHVQEDNASIFGKWLSNQSGWLVRLRKDTNNMGLRFEVQYATTNLISYVSGAGLIPLNQWTHIAVVWSGTSTAADVQFYVNGTLLTTGRANTNAVGLRKDDSSRQILISSSATANPASAKFKGRLGPLKVYGRELTASEIVSDMMYPLAMLVPVTDKRRARYQLVPAAGAPQVVDFDRQAVWNVRSTLDVDRSTTWNVAATALPVEVSRITSWNIEAVSAGTWPLGPINKRPIGFYEVNVVTPTLIELTLIHTTANAEQRPTRWNFVGPDWISLTNLPQNGLFVVRQQIVP